jgi:hypothetical protein
MTAGALTIIMGLGLFAFPAAARASEEGRRNTALALGAAAAGLLLTQKNKVPGLIAGAGAAYAYSRYQDKVNDRHKRERYYGRYDRYDDYRYSDYGSSYDRYDRNYDRYGSYDRYDRSYDRNDRYDRNYSRYDSERRYNRQYDDNSDCNNRSRRR